MVDIRILYRIYEPLQSVKRALQQGRQYGGNQCQALRHSIAPIFALWFQFLIPTVSRFFRKMVHQLATTVQNNDSNNRCCRSSKPHFSSSPFFHPHTRSRPSQRVTRKEFMCALVPAVQFVVGGTALVGGQKNLLDTGEEQLLVRESALNTLSVCRLHSHNYSITNGRCCEPHNRNDEGE